MTMHMRRERDNDVYDVYVKGAGFIMICIIHPCVQGGGDES